MGWGSCEKAEKRLPKQPMSPQKSENLDNFLLLATEKMVPQDKDSKGRARFASHNI